MISYFVNLMPSLSDEEGFLHEEKKTHIDCSKKYLLLLNGEVASRIKDPVPLCHWVVPRFFDLLISAVHLASAGGDSSEH